MLAAVLYIHCLPKAVLNSVKHAPCSSIVRHSACSNCSWFVALPLHATVAQVELDIRPDGGDDDDAPPDRSLLFTSSHKEVRSTYDTSDTYLVCACMTLILCRGRPST
jgi:hypothetical protein